MFIDILRRFDEIAQRGQNITAFRVIHTFDPRRHQPADVKRAAGGIGIGHEDRLSTMHQLLEPVAGHSGLGGGEIIKLQHPPAFQLFLQCRR